MCTLVQALKLCTGRTAHRASRGIALLFLDDSTRRGELWASRPGHSLPLGKTRYPLYRRLGEPQGRSGHVRKISPPTRIRFPHLPARSQSLYRLSCQAKLLTPTIHVFTDNTCCIKVKIPVWYKEQQFLGPLCEDKEMWPNNYFHKNSIIATTNLPFTITVAVVFTRIKYIYISIWLYGMFVNCNWVDTRWQQHNTHT